MYAFFLFSSAPYPFISFKYTQNFSCGEAPLKIACGFVGSGKIFFDMVFEGEQPLSAPFSFNRNPFSSVVLNLRCTVADFGLFLGVKAGAVPPKQHSL